MNANKLADKSFMELWDSYTSKKMECEDLHEKICQQQAKIDNLLENNARLDAEIELLKSQPANACKHGVDDGACKECYLESSNPYKAITDTKIEATAVSYNPLTKAQEVIYEATGEEV